MNQTVKSSGISLWLERLFLSLNGKHVGTLYLTYALFSGLFGTAFSVLIILELFDPSLGLLEWVFSIIDSVIEHETGIGLYKMSLVILCKRNFTTTNIRFTDNNQNPAVIESNLRLSLDNSRTISGNQFRDLEGNQRLFKRDFESLTDKLKHDVGNNEDLQRKIDVEKVKGDRSMFEAEYDSVEDINQPDFNNGEYNVPRNLQNLQTSLNDINKVKHHANNMIREVENTNIAVSTECRNLSQNMDTQMSVIRSLTDNLTNSLQLHHVNQRELNQHTYSDHSGENDSRPNTSSTENTTQTSSSNSLIDDFADVSSEMPDYTSGDD